MVKKIFVFYAFMTILNASNASSIVEPQSTIVVDKTSCFLNIIGTKVNQTSLPSPYNYLLTQPLMTKGIEKYYQRTPIIQTIYGRRNPHNNTYFRAIKMLLDSNTIRNNVELAQKNEQEMVVELAFITMNFNALPEKIITSVLNTNVPFGQLLINNHVKIAITDRFYFSTQCNKKLSSLTGCQLNSTIYGRNNTIFRADNNKWLAHVVEILPGFLYHRCSF